MPGGTLTSILCSLLHRDYRQCIQGPTARRWQKLNLHNGGEDLLLVPYEHLSYFSCTIIRKLAATLY